METSIIEHIETYLNGDLELSELKKIALEHNITDLEKEIEWVENTQLAIEAEGLEKQLQKLLKTDNQSEPSKVVTFSKSNKRGRYTALSIAASVVLLFGLLFIFKPNQTNKLYSKYEFVDPGIPVLMSETNKFELYEALSYYSEQNYTETINRLSSLKNSNNGVYNDTIDFYLGISNLYKNELNTSLPLIEQVSNDENSIFKERAEWLVALNHVKLNNIKDARFKLHAITNNNNHPFYHQAVALLSDIEK